MSKQAHFERNGQWVCREVTTKPVMDRLTTPTARTKYKGEGIGLGTWVEGSGRPQPWRDSVPISGQIWCKAEGKGYWWVADGVGYYIMHESVMTVTAHADTDSMLFDAS